MAARSFFGKMRALVHRLPAEPGVLVIDDDEDLCARIASDLARNGYRVETAYNADQALIKARKGRFALAITDLSMPEMNGVDAIPLLRKIAPDMRFLVATGYPPIEAKIACMKAGAADFIRKPFAIADLIALIETTLAR